jgi:hypothetical protein
MFSDINLKWHFSFICDVFHITDWDASLQEEQSFNQRTKRTSTWIQGLVLPNPVLTVLPYTMHGLPVEAAQILLEKSFVHCD